MKVIAELEPTRNREKLLARVKMLAPNVDAIDIPEAPMGRPIASAPVLAAHLKALYPTLSFIPHIRVIDVNRVGLLSIAGGLKAAGVEEAVLLRGDDPAEGTVVNDLDVEEAAALVKTRIRGAPRLGAMLSIRYPREKIASRLLSSLDFFMVLRALHDREKLAWVAGEARRLGKRLYAYIIVYSERNREKLLSMLGDQPLYPLDRVEEAAEALRGTVDGVVVSSPGDVDAVVKACQRLARIV